MTPTQTNEPATESGLCRDLLAAHGPRMRYSDVAQLLKRKTEKSFRNSLYASGRKDPSANPVMAALRQARRRIGRQVLFDTREVAAIIERLETPAEETSSALEGRDLSAADPNPGAQPSSLNSTNTTSCSVSLHEE